VRLNKRTDNNNNNGQDLEPMHPSITTSSDLTSTQPHTDSVHQPLLDLHDQLHEALYRGDGHKIIWSSLQQLESYTKKQLQQETSWLRSPPHGAHKLLTKLHHRFTQQIKDWIKEYHAGANILTIELVSFLQRWFRELQQHSLTIGPSQQPQGS
jgi:hemerythrin-like metal-binding protein